MFIKNNTYATEKYGEFYEIDENYVTRILPKTTTQMLKNNLDNQNIEITKSNGEELQEGEYIGTGMTLKDGENEYTTSVVGDLDGNGKLTITDLAKLNLHTVNIKKVDDEFLKSTDINNDGKTSITDLTQVNLAVVNLRRLYAPASFTPTATMTGNTITVSGESNEQGVEYSFKLDNGEWVQNTDKTNGTYTFANVDNSQKHNVVMKITDKDGNETKTETVSVYVKDIYVVLVDEDRDGKGETLVFTNTEPTEEPNNIVKRYGNIEGKNYIWRPNVPWSNDGYTITKVRFLDKIFPISTANWFSGLRNLTSIEGIRNLDTSNAIDMSYMFDYCESLVELDLSYFDTSKVTDMQFMFDNCKSLTNLDLGSFNTSNVGDMEFMFADCESLRGLYLDDLDTRNVRDMTCMFEGCKNLTNINVSYFDTSNTISMSGMFEGCSSLQDVDISNFNTGHVLDMGSMFKDCKNMEYLNLGNLNTNSLSNISSMFENCENLQHLNVANWNTQAVKDMSSVFSNCKNIQNLDLTDWNTVNVSDMKNMFKNCEKLQDLHISNFNPTVTDISSMFENCKQLKNLDLRKININEKTNYSNIFKNSGLETIYGNKTWIRVNENPGTSFDNSNTDHVIIELTVTFDANGGKLKDPEIFGDGEAYEIKKFVNYNDKITLLTPTRDGYEFVKWNTESESYNAGDEYTVTDDVTFIAEWEEIRKGIYIVLVDNDNDGVGETLEFSSMPSTNPNIIQNYGDFSNVDYEFMMEWPWYNNTEITTVSFIDRIQPLSTAYWFYGLSNLDKINDINNLDTSNVRGMCGMFYGCSSLRELDVSGFNTSNATTMVNMFRDCNKLTELDVSGFDTHNVKRMFCMFKGCNILTGLDVSGFDTEKITDMESMFSECSRLRELDVSEFYTENVTNMTCMFYGCSSLTELDVSNFNTEKVNEMTSMFEECSNLTELDLKNFDITNVMVYVDIFKNSGLESIYGNKTWLKVNQNPNGSFTNSNTDHVIIDLTVDFVSNGGILDETTITADYGEIIDLPTPTRELYKFIGWYTDESLTEKIDGDTYTVTDDTTLYAKWEMDISLTLTAKPKVDIMLTKATSKVDLSTFKEDLRAKLIENNINPDDINVIAAKTRKVYEGENKTAIQTDFDWKTDVNTSIGNIIFVTDEYINGLNAITLKNLCIEDKNNLKAGDIMMYGNPKKMGKNAMWIESSRNQEQELTFDYDVNFGDNLNAACILLRVVETDKTNHVLSGYMLSLNQCPVPATLSGTAFGNAGYAYYTLCGNKSAGLWKITYDGNNTTRLLSKTLVQALDIDATGTLTISATENQIKVNGGGLESEYVVDLDGNWQSGNGFGFMTEHYTHDCQYIGSFIVKNLSLTTVTDMSIKEILCVPEWRENAEKILLNVEDYADDELDDTNIYNELLTRFMNQDVHFMAWGTQNNKTQFEDLISKINRNGTYINNTNYDNALDTTVQYIKDLMDSKKDISSQYVLLGTEVKIDSNYDDLLENTIDANWPQGKWKVIHDNTYFENDSGQLTNNLDLTFDKPGKYEIYYENVLVSTIYVHRRPVAQIIIERDGQNTTFSSESYDVDALSSTNNGIVEEEWKWRYATDTIWNDGKLTDIDSTKDYIISLRVKDNQDTWSNATTAYITSNTNSAPMSLFKVVNTVIRVNEGINVVDTSYDPKGEEIVKYDWEIYSENSSEPVLTFEGKDISFVPTEIGEYKIYLIVTNESGKESEKYGIKFTAI